MRDRIGALHLHYRVVGGDALGAALAPRLDRAIEHGLGAAVDERLAAMFADNPEVIVIRELAAPAMIGPDDLTLDRRVVEAIGRASAAAVATVLERPPSADTVVRFADQAEFVGSFLLELLDGTAWDRWYYGAFQTHRCADLTATLAAVLDDNRMFVASILGWLSRRGRLDEVLSRLTPGQARRLTSLDGGPMGAGPLPQVEPLVAAGFAILAALGWSPETSERDTYVAEYLTTAPVPPSWSDRRSLTAWVLGFVQFVTAHVRHSSAVRLTSDRDRIHELLSGPLDWLDAAWLEPLLADLLLPSSPRHESASRGRPSVLTPRHERAMERLLNMLRRGRVVVTSTDSREAVVVKLVAALAEDDLRPARLDAPLMALVDCIAEAYCRAVVSRGDADVEIPRPPARLGRDDRRVWQGSSLAGSAAEAVRTTSPAGYQALQQLLALLPAATAGVATQGAPLFLLTRALLDVRLDVLARTADVPFAPLRALLANQWLDLQPPFDRPTAVWTGIEQPDGAALEPPLARLSDLADALLSLLRDQRTLGDLPPEESWAADAQRVAGATGCSLSTSLAAARIAWMLMRSWSRWLPGIGGASTPFLVRNCLERKGRVTVTDADIDVQLDPAPFDVVLELAGYYGPIERVSWLGGRRVAFTVRRHASR